MNENPPKKLTIEDGELPEDPHRLGRRFLESLEDRLSLNLKSLPETMPVIRYDYGKGTWSVLKDGELRAVSTKWIKSEIYWFVHAEYKQAFLKEREEYESKKPKIAFWGGRKRNPPQMRIVTNDVVRNVLLAIKSMLAASFLESDK